MGLRSHYHDKCWPKLFLVKSLDDAKQCVAHCRYVKKPFGS